MIRAAFFASVAALLAVSEPFDPPVAQAEIVKAWCVVTWTDGSRDRETGNCDFRQSGGNIQVWMGDRWKFVFLDVERGQSYERNNTEDFVGLKRGGYVLQVFQGGQPAAEPGGF